MTSTDHDATRHDYDLFGADYVADPASFWQRFREQCPVARSDDYGGSWLPVRNEDVRAVARDVDAFTSSLGVSVVEVPERKETLKQGNPPIDADPPLHTWTRRLMLPAMSPSAVGAHEASTRELCRNLIAGFEGKGRADAAADYAQQIPVRVIGALLGIPEEQSDRFVEWVRSILEFAHDTERRNKAMTELAAFLREQVAERRIDPGPDMISEMVAAEIDGAPIDEDLIVGEAALLLVAGVDTTWSAIGSALYHLASHPDDRRRLATDPDVWPFALEEFLRFYSPVTMARISTRDTKIGECPIATGDRVLLSFPAANRDEDAFEDADTFIIDRAQNRHLAFGVGIHRCAGSNLARMELRIALEEWMAAIPEFELADPAKVTWAGGQVRGPRSVPVVFPPKAT
jgi:cytochrome P450